MIIIKHYKEKCIDIEILFHPSFKENFSLLRKITQEKQKFILEIMEKYFKEIKANGHEVVNLRILNYIYFKLNELNFIQNETQIDEYWKNTIFMTMTFLFYIKKNQDLAIGSVEELMNYLRNKSPKNEENSEKTKLRELFYHLKPKENILYKKNEQFFIRLLHFWETEVITESLKREIIKDINSFYKKIKHISDLSQKSYIINNMYLEFLTDLHCDKFDFVKKVWNFLNENKGDLIYFTDITITHIISLLSKLIEFDPENEKNYKDFAKNFFKNYVKLNATNDIESVFDRDSNVYDVLNSMVNTLKLDKHTLKQVINDFKETYIKKTFGNNCNEILTKLKTIIEKRERNYSESAIIKSPPKEKLKKCFLETGDLSLIAHFFKYKSRSNRFENFKIILREILDELEQESDYNEKILELKKYLGIDTQ